MRLPENARCVFEIEAAAAKTMEARTPLRIDGEDSSEIAGSSTDIPDDADGPTPYDYMAIVLAVAWLGPTVYYTVFGDGDALALDSAAESDGTPKLPSNHPPVPRGSTSLCDAALRGDGGGGWRTAALAASIAAATVAGALWMARRHRFVLNGAAPAGPPPPPPIPPPGVVLEPGQRIGHFVDGKRVELVVPGPPPGRPPT